MLKNFDQEGKLHKSGIHKYMRVLYNRNIQSMKSIDMKRFDPKIVPNMVATYFSIQLLNKYKSIVCVIIFCVLQK